MTVIDTKNGISYPFMTADQAAKIIGVCRMTVYRWKAHRQPQTYNHFLIVFSEVNKGNVTRHSHNNIYINR